MNENNFNRFVEIMSQFGYSELTPFSVLAYLANIPKHDFAEVIENLIDFQILEISNGGLYVKTRFAEC